MSDNLLNAIRDVQRPHDDTIYCHPEHEEKLLQTIDGFSGSHRGITNVTIAGLDVEARDCFEFILICQKGDVFPIAKDYK